MGKRGGALVLTLAMPLRTEAPLYSEGDQWGVPGSLQQPRRRGKEGGSGRSLHLRGEQGDVTTEPRVPWGALTGHQASPGIALPGPGVLQGAPMLGDENALAETSQLPDVLQALAFCVIIQAPSFAALKKWTSRQHWSEPGNQT